MKTSKKVDIMQGLKDTGRTLYVDEGIAKSAPQSEETDLQFFKLDRYMSDDALEQEYEKHGLRPATILELCMYDKVHQDMLDEKKYICSHWKDADGKWCFVALDRWRDERNVYVNRRGHVWNDGWWGCGVHKSALGTGNSELALEPLSLDSLSIIITCIEFGDKKYKIHYTVNDIHMVGELDKPLKLN